MPVTSPSTRKIVAVLDDLFFQVKIHEAAKRAGLPIEFVKSETDTIDRAKLAPELIILDLNCGAVNAVDLITKLKGSDETKGVDIIGFVSHVQGELKQQAQQAGYNMVLARSAFSLNLPQILKRHS
jgi:CheY-like chemotaxis protein